MKAISPTAVGAIALGLAAAACVPASNPPAAAASPTPTPAAAAPAPVQVTPAPVAAPAPAAASTLAASQFADYLDAPQTPGDWSYGADPDETLAIFNRGESSAPFIIRCVIADREIWLGRRGSSRAGQMRIRTETVSRTLAVNPVEGQRDLVAARISARDPLLDAMALSKGRFAVETAGLPALYLPAWAEVTRVIEDCR